MQRYALAVALGLVTLATVANAYPRYWWDADANGAGIDPSQGSCTLHPSEMDASVLASAGGPPFYSPHVDAPIKGDVNLLFEVRDASGVRMTVCPGGSYSLKVTYNLNALFMLTVSEGVVSNALPNDKCSNRATFGTGLSWRREAAMEQNTTWTVPCTARGNVQVKATCAGGDGAGSASWTYRTNLLNILVDSSCVATACAPAVPKLPPSPAKAIITTSPPRATPKSPPPKPSSPPRVSSTRKSPPPKMSGSRKSPPPTKLSRKPPSPAKKRPPQRTPSPKAASPAPKPSPAMTRRPARGSPRKASPSPTRAAPRGHTHAV